MLNGWQQRSKKDNGTPLHKPSLGSKVLCLNIKNALSTFEQNPWQRSKHAHRLHRHPRGWKKHPHRAIWLGQL